MALSAAKAKKAHIAFQRFGLGAVPGKFESVGKDAEGALEDEVKQNKVAKIPQGKLPSYGAACKRAQMGEAEDIRKQELAARVDKHLDVRIGYVERLVMFWSNHFSMNVGKSGAVRGTIGQLERDVIREHVLGNFTDMMLGVYQHPAMMSYLDNDDSVGPNSEYGQHRGVGFNENLAREAMELHTVGSGGGYTEKDVTNLSLILTGWSYVRNWEADYEYNGGHPGNRGKFIFRRDWAEPGKVKLRGKIYKGANMQRAKDAIKDLTRSPETAEHIAFKLVRHFITDEPTKAMVKPIARTFEKTKGDLKRVSLELLRLPEAFSTPMKKLRTPYELSIAQFRALKTRYADDTYWSFAGPLRAMQHMPWEYLTPEGFPDETLYWLDPDGMTLRLETALYAGRVYDEQFKSTPKQLARDLFGDVLTRDTRERVEAASSIANALAILFCSPEFQRR